MKEQGFIWCLPNVKHYVWYCQNHKKFMSNGPSSEVVYNILGKIGQISTFKKKFLVIQAILDK
jgi:hypothetical protein